MMRFFSSSNLSARVISRPLGIAMAAARGVGETKELAAAIEDEIHEWRCRGGWGSP